MTGTNWFENITLVNERIRRGDAEESLQQMLLSDATNPQDPVEKAKARMALIDILTNPSKFDDHLLKYFTPEPPQMSPDQQAFAGAQSQGPQYPTTSPDVATVLSRLESNGNIDAGVQTVGRL